MVFDRGFGGYRSAILAIAGLILIGAGEPPKGQTKSPASNGYQEVSSGNQSASSSLKSAQKSKNAAEKCGADRYQSNDDLCAQWKAADAAANAAKASWYQFWLGIAGLLVGFFTLCAAIAAAWFARSAATHTETAAIEAQRAGNAAETALQLAEETSRIQLQPYVFPERVWLTDFDEDMQRDICMTLKNYGQTPAMFVDPQLGFSLQEFPVKKIPMRHGIEGPRLATIPPGGTTVVRLVARRVHQSAWDSIRHRRMAFVVYIALRYESRFKKGAQSWSGWFYSTGADIDAGKFDQLAGRDAEQED